MPTVDWIFLAVLLVSLIVGAWRGLVFEVLSVLSWAAAFVLAQWFAPDVAAHLSMSGAGEPIRYAAGFVIVFVASIFAGGLVAFLVKKLVASVGLGPADRLLGAGFGLVRGVLLLLAVISKIGLASAEPAIVTTFVCPLAVMFQAEVVSTTARQASS